MTRDDRACGCCPGQTTNVYVVTSQVVAKRTPCNTYVNVDIEGISEESLERLNLRHPGLITK